MPGGQAQAEAAAAAAAQAAAEQEEADKLQAARVRALTEHTNITNAVDSIKSTGANARIRALAIKAEAEALVPADPVAVQLAADAVAEADKAVFTNSELHLRLNLVTVAKNAVLAATTSAEAEALLPDVYTKSDSTRAAISATGLAIAAVDPKIQLVIDRMNLIALNDINGFHEAEPSMGFTPRLMDTSCNLTCPPVSFTGFTSADLPVAADIDFSGLTAATLKVTDGRGIIESFTGLIEAGKPHIAALLESNRINYETYAKYTLDLIGLAMQNSIGAATAAIDAESKKIDAQVRIAELALKRAAMGSDLIIQQANAGIDIKAKYAQSILEVDAAKVALRDKLLSGWWDRKLKASGVSLKNGQASLFKKQIDGFDSKKQNELFKHLLDVWTITATEELLPQWRFKFTDKEAVAGAAGPYSQSDLEKWLRKYVADTKDIKI